MFRLLSTLTLLVVLNSTSWGEIILIVSKDSPLSSITTAKLKKLYFGKERFINNKPILLVDMKGEVQNAFTKIILHRSPTRYKNAWKKLIFSGLGTPPRLVSSCEELIAFLRKNPYAIGYTSTACIPENARYDFKVLTLTD